MKNKVLIITNPLNHEGGVVNYYNLFFKHFKSETVQLKHKSIGSRAYLFYYPILKRILYPIYFLYDIFTYILLLVFDRKIAIVQVSPSLIPVPLIRDGILILIAKILGKKTIVFYRGWKLPTLQKIQDKTYLKKFFNYIFQNGTQQFVLASSFKNDLLELFPANSSNIQVTKTAIEKNSIVNGEYCANSLPIKILFLARIQNLKGVEELIDAICILNINKRLRNFQFTIAGHEERVGYVDELKQKLKLGGLPDNQVIFPGRVTGNEKFNLYASHDIYILPSYSEGCPNSVLEALASGLYCITTPVGALQDLVKPENGMLIKEKSVNAILEALLYTLSIKDFNRDRIKRGEKYSEIFDISKITQKFDSTYNELISKR